MDETQPDLHARQHAAGTFRAAQIASALVTTARAHPIEWKPLDDNEQFRRLERTDYRGAYWIHVDTGEVRAGRNFATAETLSPGFVNAVLREAGARREPVVRAAAPKRRARESSRR